MTSSFRFIPHTILVSLNHLVKLASEEEKLKWLGDCCGGKVFPHFHTMESFTEEFRQKEATGLIRAGGYNMSVLPQVGFRPTLHKFRPW